MNEDEYTNISVDDDISELGNITPDQEPTEVRFFTDEEEKEYWSILQDDFNLFSVLSKGTLTGNRKG